MARISLTKKTKIATWWIIIVAGIGVVRFWPGSFSINLGGDYMAIGLGMALLWLVSMPLVLAGVLFLLTGRKWAWGISLGFLVLASLIAFYSLPFFLTLLVSIRRPFGISPRELSSWRCLFPIIPAILYLPPLFLLLIDAKNFWRGGSLTK